MASPRVSVCIATYDQHRYIRQCIESVLAESTDNDLEVLVGDDCSVDGTSEIVSQMAKAYPDLIRHVRHSPRKGGVENVKALLALATGEFIARLDGDDYWLPGKLKHQLAYLAANPGCAAVYTNAITIDEAGNRIGVFNDAGEARFELAAMLRRGNFLNNSSVLFRSECIPPWLAIAGPLIDYRAHLLHARRGYLAQLAEPLVVYRVNAQGSMVSEMNDYVRELYWEAILSVPREFVTDDDIAHGMADFFRRVIFRALNTGRWSLLRKWTPIVFDASPYGIVGTAFLTACSLLRVGSKELIGRCGSHRLKVLYRR